VAKKCHFFSLKPYGTLLDLCEIQIPKKEDIMTNIIKKDNAQPATFGSVVDQLFHQNLNRWFDDDFWGFHGVRDPYGVPVNIRETDKTYELELVAPGLEKEDFQLNFTNDVLTISFDHKEDSTVSRENQRWLRKEYRKQSFMRTFNVDETVDVDKAVARYEKGVLLVTLPKKDHAQRVSRTINIQ
jgi:HSP20 family protein